MNENNIIYERIIEYILYKRDRNPDKDWGHICGWTTIFSYCRWNINYSLEEYKIYIDKNYKTDDVFIIMLQDWHNGNYERKYLRKYSLYDNYLYNFIYAISPDKTHKYDYYFRFAETIDDIGLKYLLKSYKQNSNYLFANIALASYYFHNHKLNLSYKFYVNCLKLDENNPYILYKFSMLHNRLGGLKNNLKSEKIMKKVVDLLPKSPFAYAGYGEILNILGKYFDSLKYFEKYEKLTEGKHRTFEPFMRKAESYIGLGDFKKAREELNKEKIYYFGEGYRFVYNYIDKNLKNLLY